MPRIYLFAEGTTELTFADTVLKPHLANLGCTCTLRSSSPTPGRKEWYIAVAAANTCR